MPRDLCGQTGIVLLLDWWQETEMVTWRSIGGRTPLCLLDFLANLDAQQ